MDLDTMEITNKVVWDMDYSEAGMPFITGNYLYYSVSHLTQTTEFVRFDLSNNFTTTRYYPDFLKYLPKTIAIDHSVDRYVYIPLDTDVVRVQLRDRKGNELGFVESEIMTYNSLNYASGAVFMFSNVDEPNQLLFLVASNGIVFIVDISAHVENWFYAMIIVLIALLPISLFAIVLVVCIRNSKKLYRQRKIEGEMKALLDERYNTSGYLSSSQNSHEHDFESSKWIIKMDDLKFEERISEGSFGVVFKGLLHGRTAVAIKKLKRDDQYDEFEQEVQILLHLRHPHTVLFIGVCVNDDYRFIVTEYCNGGSLEDVLYERKTKRSNRKKKHMHQALSFKKKCSLLHDVINGMVYLHSMTPPICHRDLKPSNILLDKNLTVAKVCDFGTSKLLSMDMTMTGRIGTIRYMSPEVIRNERYDQRSDIYSFAIVMYETFFEQAPYTSFPLLYNHSSSDSSSSNSEELINPWNLGLQIAKGVRPVLPDEETMAKFSDAEKCYIDIMKRCWDHDPSKRPTFAELTHIFAKSFK
jgi:hypothetical protein